MTERFIIHPASIGSIIIDANTGLWWQTDYATGKTWQQAIDYAESLNTQEYAGYSDWRLPTIEELITLINYKRFDPASDFPDMPSDWFWSSSSEASKLGVYRPLVDSAFSQTESLNYTLYAWSTSFYYGTVFYSGKVGGGKVRCVRDGRR